jgi:hypothetical protein
MDNNSAYPAAYEHPFPLASSELSASPAVGSVRPGEKSVCDCLICQSIEASGLTESELIHFLATRSAKRWSDALIEKARCEANLQLATIKRDTLDLVIREKKAAVEKSRSDQAEVPNEAKP